MNKPISGIEVALNDLNDEIKKLIDRKIVSGLNDDLVKYGGKSFLDKNGNISIVGLNIDELNKGQDIGVILEGGAMLTEEGRKKLDNKQQVDAKKDFYYFSGTGSVI